MINLIRNILIAVTILFLNTACAQEQSTPTKYDFSNVDSIIFNGIVDEAYPGAVVLINLKGEIIYKNSYGNFSYDKNSSKVELNTVFDLASLTKALATTSAAMICVDKGLFKVDDPVYKYIPEFDTTSKKKITIENLLLHNSGLPRWKKYYGSNLSAEKIIDDIININLVYPVGEASLYSDPGMIIMGKVIEKVSGKTLDKFCEDELFTKLKLENSFFNPPDSLKYRIAPTENDTLWRMKQIHGEVHDETASMLGGVAGHAGLFSTAEDISKLISVLLYDLKNRDGKLFNQQTVKMFTERVDGRSRALGWDLKSETGSSAGSLFGKNSFGHTGFTGTSIWVDPDRDLFVVFLTNRIYPTRDNKKLLKIRPILHDEVIKSIDQ